MIDPTLDPEQARLPQPAFFDPAFERIPASAMTDGDTHGAVLLLFDPAVERAWVADAAISLATAWAQTGRRVILCDLDLDDPLLHERIGMANQDGIVDVFLYGTSLARAARPVPGRGFYLISAGTYAAEPEAIYRNDRWEALVGECEAGASSLLLLAPLSAPGLALLSRWAGRAILLGTPGFAQGADVLENISVDAWLAPPAAPEPVHDLAHPHNADDLLFPTAEPTSIAAVHAPMMPQRTPHVEEEFRPAELIQGQPPASLPVPDPTWEADEIGDGTVARRSARGVSLLLFLLLLLALAAGVYYALTTRPDLLGIRPGSAVGPPAAAPQVASPVAAAPAESGAPLPFAVSVINFDALAPAERAVAAHRTRFPDVPFYIVPEDNAGRLYYKVFAGALADTAQAAALRDRLVAAEVADSAAFAGLAQMIDARPWSYDLGTFTTDALARAHTDSVALAKIPAYVLPVPFADGSTRWRVFGGAFADSLTARPMLRMISAAKLRAPLVRRTGAPPSAP